MIQFDAPLIQPKRNRLSALEAKVAATQPSFLATIGGRVPDADLKKPGEWKVADLQTALQQTWLLDELETKITRAYEGDTEQFGFRPLRSTVMAVAALKNVAQTAIQSGQSLYVGLLGSCEGV